MRKLLHTPEGVRDIYNEECAKKMVLQENLQNLLLQYGYSAIQTPTFEFFDIFGQEIGTTASRDLYKFFDREGNTLVLRPDITPSIARSVTNYFSQEDMPIRLWYSGNIFINNSSYQGRLKESTQLGAELIGDDSVDADAEILALVVNALKTAGLREFQITVGHVGFWRGLVKAANLTEETVAELEILISNKNFFGVEEIIHPLSIPKELKKMFGKLGTLFDTAEGLLEIKELAGDYPVMKRAIDRLISLYETLTFYEVEKYISLELGMLSSYRYYTGIIFSGYTFGSGEPIVKGGRYDDLLPYFGKQSPSIGFAVVIDQLMAALTRQKIGIPTARDCQLIVYRKTRRKEAIDRVNELRKGGAKAMLIRWKDEMSREDYLAFAARMHLNDTVFLDL